MATEITGGEEHEKQTIMVDSKEAEEIRQIINYQKALHLSLPSSSSSSSLSSPRKSSSLLNLMKEGSSSLRRLFHMEHVSLGDYLKDFRISPIIKPMFLWGSETDKDIIVHDDDPWAETKQRNDDQRDEEDFVKRRLRPKTRKRKLIRTKSYRSLPRFNFWRFGGFKFRLRFIRRIRIRIWG